MEHSQGSSARPTPRNVANAIVVKDGDVFLLCEHGGSIPCDSGDGFGLYYHDCSFINGYELQLAGTRPTPLVSISDQGGIAEFELTNQEIPLPDRQTIPPRKFGVTIQRLIDSAHTTMYDTITVRNYD